MYISSCFLSQVKKSSRLQKNNRLLRGETVVFLHTVCRGTFYIWWQRTTHQFYQMPPLRHTDTPLQPEPFICFHLTSIVSECVLECVWLHFFAPQLTVKMPASNRLLTGARGRWWHHLRPIAGPRPTDERKDGRRGWRDGEGRKGRRDGGEECF